MSLPFCVWESLDATKKRDTREFFLNFFFFFFTILHHLLLEK